MGNAISKLEYLPEFQGIVCDGHVAKNHFGQVALWMYTAYDFPERSQKKKKMNDKKSLC